MDINKSIARFVGGSDVAKIYQVRVDIYEPSIKSFPIVVHVFNGRTPEEAWHFHGSHRASDRFLRDCEDKDLFAGNVPCRAVVTEGWVTG